MSDAMQSAIQSFSESGTHHLQAVRIVVFEKDMIDIFSSPKSKSDKKRKINIIHSKCNNIFLSQVMVFLKLHVFPLGFRE